MATLEDLLTRFPDNAVGAIDADDMRAAIAELWAYTAEVQRQLNEVVVDGVNALTARIHAGEVDQLGNLVDGSDGWSAAKVDTGVVQVTHNLGTDRYAVALTPMVKADDAYATSIYETSETTFTYRTHSAAQGTLHDTYVSFVMVVAP